MKNEILSCGVQISSFAADFVLIWRRVEDSDWLLVLGGDRNSPKHISAWNILKTTWICVPPGNLGPTQIHSCFLKFQIYFVFIYIDSFGITVFFVRAIYNYKNIEAQNRKKKEL